MRSLDLHGIRHAEVDEKVRNFLNFTELPCEIITGNSPRMKEIVKNIVSEYEWFSYERDIYNQGILVVVENKFW